MISNWRILTTFTDGVTATKCENNKLWNAPGMYEIENKTC